ncbi:MAG: hypothetical protein OXH76_06810 [Boseongicola sp.]|nr:hypothetical protein [Boseongicola sp.]
MQVRKFPAHRGVLPFESGFAAWPRLFDYTRWVARRFDLVCGRGPALHDFEKGPDLSPIDEFR